MLPAISTDLHAAPTAASVITVWRSVHGQMMDKRHCTDSVTFLVRKLHKRKVENKCVDKYKNIEGMDGQIREEESL